MFHIKQLELVHWDFWSRFTLPLDAQIITIVGPNGSGKTTLLDALRTLFALRCSGKRDFRRYVRRTDRDIAWIRAVVANNPSGTGKRPFFPCLRDEVTLACRIRRAGGDWTRDYAIVDGNADIDTLEANGSDWVGLRDYQNRLAWGGLTPAIAKVLSLEQGDTDKLCEYSPRPCSTWCSTCSATRRCWTTTRPHARSRKAPNASSRASVSISNGCAPRPSRSGSKRTTSASGSSTRTKCRRSKRRSCRASKWPN
jgi:energy-coupling factor transporter ATP-binding protein EcfA2